VSGLSSTQLAKVLDGATEAMLLDALVRCRHETGEPRRMACGRLRLLVRLRPDDEGGDVDRPRSESRSAGRSESSRDSLEAVLRRCRHG